MQPKFESVAATILRGKGYEEFLPVYCAKRRWSDRVKRVNLPLFPGYMFCRLDLSTRILPVLTTPGVINIVGPGRTPIPISEEEIRAIEVVIQSGLPAQPWPFLATGTRVFIARGPLAGLDGIVTSTEKKYRLIVAMDLLQRSVAVEIDREWVQPISQRATAPTSSA